MPRSIAPDCYRAAHTPCARAAATRLARTFQNRPQLRDPVGRRVVRTLLEELRRRGVSVLLNSHLLSEIELVCDRVVILLGGKVVAAGAPAELARPRGIEIETDRGRRVVDGGRDDVPRVVADLVRSGERVFEARVLTSTLEEVYLEAVGGETS